MPEPRLIACLIYPDVMSLDVTGPLQVFASANVERQRQGLPPFYRIQVLGERSEAVPSSAGIRICADLAWRDCPPESLDTLLVPGGLGVEAQTRNADLLAWLKAAEPRIRRLGSVCSGALILAAAGVLDGHPATTHWADVATLRQGFPGVHVQGDRLHTYDPQCRDGDAHIFTSAGVTAGIDLVLRRPVVRAAIACTAAGHGLMILIMNATPLAMSFCGLPLEQSSRVIQWHVLGMFLPAFFAGALVDRIGNRRVALLGAFLLAASAGIALGGQSVMHFLLSSLALGSGWNLMLIAGTTLLGEGHAESERGAAQGLMEQGNSLVAALMSFGSGA
ncbi:transcriptional regulator [Pseudomonas aeruginosa VRFPA09]|nr:transcriptional regulator [Pseudomonas aeruginosa VRFPA09]